MGAKLCFFFFSIFLCLNPVLASTQIDETEREKPLLPLDVNVAGLFNERQQIVICGIAAMMIRSINRHLGQSESDSQVEEKISQCNFWIEKNDEMAENNRDIFVVIVLPVRFLGVKIEDPELMGAVAFAVEKGQSFGLPGDPPLSAKQYDLLLRFSSFER